MAFSTITVKAKKCKSCGDMRPLFSRGRCQQCAKREDFKPLKKVSDKRRKREFADESWINLRDELDALQSLYVRLKDADSNGINYCYTCNLKAHYKKLQNGHVISRVEMGTRFLVEGQRPQCGFCNSRHEIEPDIFRNKLEVEVPGILAYLDEIAREVNKLTVSDLKEMVIEFREKVRIVKLKLLKP